MRFRFHLILAIVVFVAIFCSPALVQGAEVSADRAYGHVENLVKIAPRLAGTGNEATAASYIENEFRSYGLETWVENFVIEKSYVIEDNRLQMVSENSVSYNVVALLPGQSDEIMAIGAHHDSVLTAGAVDDASGVAVVLEIARVLSTENLPRTVLFVTFGSEELDLLGSKDFVSRHAENNIVVAVVFDSIAPGPKNGLRVGLRGTQEVATTEWLDFCVQKLAENLDLYACAEFYSDVNGYSDYASFTGANIPGTWVYWINPVGSELLWPIHTPADNMDAVSKTRLEQTASFGVQLVRWLAEQDLDALRQAYEYPLLLAAFAILGAGVVVLSVATGAFLHYRKGWSWAQAARVFSIVTAAMFIVIYLWLLA